MVVQAGCRQVEDDLEVGQRREVLPRHWADLFRPLHGMDWNLPFAQPVLPI